MIKNLRSPRGQTIVEFAMMLPLLLIIIVGIMDFSILFYDKAVVTNASREGARQGSIFRSNASTGAYEPLNETGIRDAVNGYLSDRAISFASTAATTAALWNATSPPSGSWTTTPMSGGTIDVLVTYSYTFLALPRFAGWNGTMDISARTIMRME